MGPARVMLFRDEKADTDNVWQLFVQDGDDKAPQPGQERVGQQKVTSPTQNTIKRAYGPKNAPKSDPTPTHTSAENKPLPFDDPLPENLLQ